MTRTAIHKAAVKILRRDLGAERLAVQHLDLVVAVAGAEMVRFASKSSGVAWAVGGDGDAGLEVAFDPVPGNAIAHEQLGLLGHGPKKLRSFLAKLALQGELIAPVPAAELPAVAPGGAIADAPRLEQDHAIATLGKVERAGKPRIAATDDADIGAHVAVKRGPSGVRPRASLVPGGRRAIVLRVAPAVARHVHQTASRRNLRSQELTTRR